MSWQYRGINEITPKDANWNYCGMKIFDLSVEGTHQIIFDNFYKLYFLFIIYWSASFSFSLS